MNHDKVAEQSEDDRCHVSGVPDRGNSSTRSNRKDRISFAVPVYGARFNVQNWRGPGGVPAEPPYRISQPVSRVL